MTTTEEMVSDASIQLRTWALEPSMSETSTMVTDEVTTVIVIWERSTADTVLECVTLSVMWLLGFLGNILVCLVIHRSRRLQSTTSSFVVSLA